MKYVLTFLFLAGASCAYSQFEFNPETPNDTVGTIANQENVYQRPFVLKGTAGKFSTALGGYMEANTNYFVTDGVGDGFSMEFRRFNIFVYSSVADRIRFISELEFEHGTKEIALETALLDIQLHRALILRGGILLPPVGAFNADHDLSLIHI